jgi:hypothetical protein
MSEWQPEIPFEADSVMDDILIANDDFPDDIPEAYRYEYPQPIERQQQAHHLSSVHRSLMMAARGSESYYDLGGNTPDPIDHLSELAEYLDNAKALKYDIVDSFERLDILHSLDVSEYKKMTKDDRKMLALHMINHVHTLEVRAGAIGADGGYEDPRYSDYGFIDEKEAEAYSRTLIRFMNLIKDSPGYKAMQEELRSTYPNQWRMNKSVRAEYKNHHQSLYVVRDTKSDKLRVHVEKVPAQIKATA